MKKKLLLFLLIIAILGISKPVMASDEKVFTLDMVKELVIKNNREIKKINSKIDMLVAQQNINYEELVKKEAGWFDAYRIKPLVDLDQVALGIKQYKTKYENSKDATSDARRELEDTQKKLNYQVEKLYIEILNIEKQIDIMQKRYDSQMRIISIERLKFQMGLTNEAGIKTLEISTSDLYKNLQLLKETLKIKKGFLNDMIGRELNSNIELVDLEVSFINANQPFEIIVKETLKNNASICQLNREIDEMEDELDNINGSNNRTIQKSSIDQSKLQLDDIKTNISQGVKSLLADLNVKTKNYQLSNLSLNNQIKILNWDKRKLELGMITENEFLNSEITYKEQLISNFEKGYEYYLAKRAVELAMEGILVN